MTTQGAATPESSLGFETIEDSLGSGIFSKPGKKEEGKKILQPVLRVDGTINGNDLIFWQRKSLHDEFE